MHPSTFPPRIPAVSRFSGTHFDRLSVAHFAAHSCHASQHIPATHPSSFPLFLHALRQAQCNTFCTDSSQFLARILQHIPATHPSTFLPPIPAHSHHASQHIPATHPSTFPPRIPAP